MAGILVKASDQSLYGPVHHGAVCEVAMNRTLPFWTVWGKPLPGGDFAAVALNTLDNQTAVFSVAAEEMGFPAGATLHVRDVTNRVDLPDVTGAWSVDLGPRGSAFVRFSLAAEEERGQ